MAFRLSLIARMSLIARTVPVFLMAMGTLAGPAVAAAQPSQVIASLRTQGGDEAGSVTFLELGDKVMIIADVQNLPPGYHGFHVHTTGVCDAGSGFMSAGGHLDLPAAAGLAGHAGDLTNLYVNRDGTGSMTFVVDRFTVADLLADGGRAVIVHADPDNFMNIPDRYGVTPDATTMETGDAGARLACGVIETS